MKISSIKILNVLGSRRIDVRVQRPITMFVGPNGTGKSSIQEAVRMALLGEIQRVENKKDYPLLVADGAKSGSVLVVTDGKFENTVELPKGDIVTAEYGYPHEVMASVLNAQRFATLQPEQRRKFLFDLTGCHATKEKVQTMMVQDRDCDPARTEAVIAMLAGGFPAACEYAKKKATEAKGAWRAVTGETYGSVKAADWKATVPDAAIDPAELTAAAAAVTALDDKIADTRREIAIIEGRAAEQKKNAAKLELAKGEAAKLAGLKDELVRHEQRLAELNEAVDDLEARAGTAPRVGLVHDMAKFLNVTKFGVSASRIADELVGRYETEFGSIYEEGDEEARAALPATKRQRDEAARAVEAGKRAVATAETAQSVIATLGTVEGSDDAATGELQAALKDLLAQRDAAAKEQDRLTMAAHAAANADAKTKNAAAHHADVMEWTKIADTLSPEGIPGELLATALKPINAMLRASATATGWKQVAISPDMQIRADGRLYQLLSESEKWRADAMIAEAIAQISDIRILMLDRVDVLDLPSRGDLLMWLDGQAQEGKLESVLLFGTLKALPTGLPDTIDALWVADGEITDTLLEAA